MFILAKEITSTIAVGCRDFAEIPIQIAEVVRTVVKLIQVGIPILLIIFGMLDLGKAVMAQKEDEIKKSQQTFIKRIIAAAVVFFVVVIVQLVVGIVAPKQKDKHGNIKNNIWSCVEEFVRW